MDEILVHISAPATHHNDQLVRRLADAYVDFESASLGYDDDQVTEVSQRPLTPIPPLQCSTDGNMHELDHPSTKESYGSFPSQLDSQTPPRYLLSKSNQPGHQFGDESNRPVGSSLEQLERIQAKWRSHNEAAPLTSGNPNKNTSASAFASSRSSNIDFIDDSQLAAAALESQLSDGLLNSDNDESQDATKEAAENCTPDSAQSHSLDCTPHARRCGSRQTSLYPSTTPQTNAAKDLMSSDLRHHPFKPGDKGEPVNLSFEDIPSCVFAPSPDISVDTSKGLPSQITPHLKGIKLQNSERFVPTLNARAIETDERGHWLLDCGSWPLKTQCRFWHSICDHISNGNLGWGVSLHREPTSKFLDDVRLYCWGEIVEHVWLCLWFCSEGELSTSKSWWLDAGEEVVVQMP